MSGQAFVAKWYTRASRVRIVVAKFDGRWRIPGGPYPIPELVALVAGVLSTLFLLPRTGHPIPTAIVGIAVTVAGVGAMRRMPYSPVPFGTRAHRVMRLYSRPVSITNDALMRTASTRSTVQPRIDVLDVLAEGVSAPSHRRQSPANTVRAARGLAEVFAPVHSPAADLFR